MRKSKMVELSNFSKSLIFIFFILLLGKQAECVNITFKIDMHGVKVNNVYLGSDWAGWDPAKFQELTDLDKDSVYEITLDLPGGKSFNYRYKFGARDWDHFEDLSGSTCGAGPSKQDRNILVPAVATVLPTNCFGYCTDCKSVLKIELTLQVDMRNQTISPDGVHVAGSFNSWNPSANLLTDLDGDGIYTATLPAKSGGVYEYKFLNGNKWGTDELVFGTCEFRSNRIAKITETSLVMPVVKFNYCGDNTEPINAIKIGCIGNSITHGGGTLSNIYTKTWPAQLNNQLGDKYYVENLGVSGRTMLKSGDFPWWNEAQYQYTFKLQPDIVVIKLGTNDSKPYNWNAAKYKTDYIAMIDSLRKMKSAPQIYISTPAKAYSAAFDISDQIITNQLIPVLKEVAKEKMVSLIDMYKATSGISTNFPDGIHPDDNGAKVIAEKVKEVLLSEKPLIKIIEKLDNKVIDNNFAWYVNGILIPESNVQSIEVIKNGTYQVAVKSFYTDDILISVPFVVDLTKLGKASILLTSQIKSPNNNAFSFSNRNGIITIGQPDLLPPWTAEMWVYKKNITPYSSLINGTNSKINLETYNENQKVGITSKGLGDWIFPSGFVVPLQTWMHLAFVCNGTKTFLYANGVLKDSLAHVLNLPRSTFGNDPQTESPDANLDEIRLWKVARSGGDLLANMKKSIDPTNPNLIGYWNADDQSIHPTDISNLAQTCSKSGVSYVENTNTAFTSSLPPMHINEVSALNSNEYLMSPGAINQDILALKVSVTGFSDPIVVNKIIANLNGTTAISDINKLNIYYTGNVPVFSTDKLFGTVDLINNGNLNFSGNQTLTSGINYFWLCANLNSNAVKGNYVDAELINLSFVGSNAVIVPSITAPVGRRVILSKPVVSDVLGSINLIPKPNVCVVSDGNFILDANTKITISNESIKPESNFLATFLSKATGYTIPVTIGGVGANCINFSIVNEENLKIEGYTLDVLVDRINVKANTPTGLFWAMQSIRQLLPAKIEAQSKLSNYNWKMPLVHIVDFPIYQHRGAMLDVCRHYFSVDMIKRYIDMLAMYKMNVFHWHLSEDQGWRVESKRYPKLNTISAMRNCPDLYGKVYTQDEIKDIVAYATQRHIDVIPEIEMPGHSVEILAAYPELGCTSGVKPYNVRCQWGVSNDMYCAGKDSTIRFIKAILDEIIPLFPSKYFHIGGDETPFDKWATCKDCAKRILEIGASNKADSCALLKQWMLKQIQDYLTSKGKTMIGWTEITHGGIPNGAIIQDWLNQAAFKSVLNGNDVIQSFAGSVYLDGGQSYSSDEPKSNGGIHSLEMLYSYNPIPGGLTTDQQKHIIGMEAPIWTELISTESHLQYMLVPRIQAFAENCWSTKENKEVQDFKNRLFYHFERFDSLKFNNRKLDAPSKAEMEIESLNSCSPMVLKSPINGNSYFWNDEGNSQGSSITVSKTGTYKLYIDWFGKQLSKTYHVNIKEVVKQPSFNVTYATDTTISISGNADNYLWYKSNIAESSFGLGSLLKTTAEIHARGVHISGAQTVSNKNAINLSSAGSYIDLGQMTALVSAKTFTIETWIKLSSWNSWGNIFRKTLNNSNRVSIELGDRGNDLYCEVGSGSNTYGFANSCIEPGSWYHIAMVYNGDGNSNENRLKLYINGIELALTYSGTIPSSTASNTPKASLNDPLLNFTGQLSDTRIWSTVRTAEEIQLYKNKEVPSYANGLLANYHFSETTGTVVHDASKKNDATLLNASDNVWTNSGPVINRIGCESIRYIVPITPTAVEILDAEKTGTDTILYPNPSNNQLTIQTKTIEIEGIKIFNQIGQQVSCKLLSTEKYKYLLDVSTLKPGIYFIHINSKQMSQYKLKFVKN